MLRVSAFSYQFGPNAFLPDHELTMASTLDAVNLLYPATLVVLVCLLSCVPRLHRPSAWVPIKVGLGLCDAALLLVLVTCAALGGAESAGPLNFAVPILAALFCVLSVLAWTRLLEPMDTLTAVLFLLVSFAVSVPLIAIAQEIAGAVGVSRTTGELVLMLLSAAVCVAMPPVPDAVRGGGGQPYAESPRSLMVVYAALMVFIACTTVLRTLTAENLETEVLYKTDLSKVILFGISLIMVLVAVLGMRRQTARVPWLVFFALCLLTLYFSIAFTSMAPVLCREVLFPSRMYAYFLLFVVSYLYGRIKGSSATVTTCVMFCLSIAVARGVFIGEAAVVAGCADPQSWVAPLLAITALGMTVLVCALVAVGQRAPYSEKAIGKDAKHDRCVALGMQCGLTAREAEILELISLGYSRKRIGEMLELSTNTVNSYAKAVYAKLGLHGRQDAIDWIERRL